MKVEPLTPGEGEVAAAAAAGLSNLAIARRRGTKVRTIANQLASVYRKLGVGSRAELAVRLGAPDADATVDLRALSARERTICHLAMLGKPNKLVAYELGLAESTVGTHLSAAMRKLGVRSRVALIRYLAGSHA